MSNNMITADAIRLVAEDMRAKQYNSGGIIATNDWGIPVGSGDTWYTVPGQSYVKFTKRYENGNKQTVEVEVSNDGTIHVDPVAFDMFMEKLGFEQK